VRPGRPSRRSLLATVALGAPLLAGCASAAPAAPAPGSPRPRRHRYGPGPQQHGDLYRPRGTSRGTVVVIHGGFWQAMYALDLGAATSADLAERGWTAWNIEYRRIGDGGGWPATFLDVAAAVDHLAVLDGADTRTVVTLGHSAGGQLAAWAASRHGSSLPGGAPRVRVTATVPQAGVLDLTSAAETGLGGSAVNGLVGGTPARVPGRYAQVDPVRRLPLGVPVRCVHGTEDTTVPITQSETFVRAAREAGDDAALVRVPGDHFALIDPSTAAWRRTVQVLDEVTGA
jgi:acetyl esterase/lipase